MYKETDRVVQARDAFTRLEETAPEQSNRFAKCAVGLPQAKWTASMVNYAR